MGMVCYEWIREDGIQLTHRNPLQWSAGEELAACHNGKDGNGGTIGKI